MPTVLRVRDIRVVLYSNDHPPPHVHALRRDGARARFTLNCPDGPVELWDHDGFRIGDVRAVGAAIAAALTDICARWSDIHGRL